MEKSLDRKLAAIREGRAGARDFILADAKDADMAFGMASPGQSPEYYGSEGRFRSLAEYREIIRGVIRQGLVDIVLMSAANSEVLAIDERLFDGSAVTPAARANDTTDIHVVRGGRYVEHPSMPFRSATIDHIQCGKAECAPAERSLGANLGLYSCTFNNDPERDRETLEHYRAFRLEAEKKGFRHFLEVFDPNVPGAVAQDKLGHFINDHIARTLAGVPRAGRPVFLKIVYHGPKFMEELASYDPGLVPGILGGASGTTYDAFKLLSEAKKHGARAALFGRKINNAEHQLAFVEILRRVADDEVTAEEGVRAYHGVLQQVGIKPHRSLDDDMKLTNVAVSYGGSDSGPVPTSVSVPTRVASPPRATPSPAGDYPRRADGTPDFAQFTQEHRLAFDRSRREKVFGRA